MRSILFTPLAFLFVFGCANSNEKEQSQIQQEAIPAPLAEVQQHLVVDTMNDKAKLIIVAEHDRFENYDPIPRERYEDVPAPRDEQFIGLEAIYHAFQKNQETFLFECNAEAEIIGEEGTKIFIPANAFVYKMSGLPARGQIDFRMTEYYKMEDILLSKLSCNTPEALLESGGMLYLEAFAGGLPCEVAPDKKLVREFVNNTPDNNMQIFDGITDTDGNIIWELQYSNSPDPVIYGQNNTKYYGDPTNTLYTACDKMPEFNGGNIDMRIWFNTQLQDPLEARDALVQGTISASFIVTDSGTIRNIQLENTLGYGCDEAVVDMLKKMPNWKPGFENDVAVDVKIELPFVFTLEDEEFLFGVTANDTFNQKRKNTKRDKWFNGSFYNDQTVNVTKVNNIDCLVPPSDTISRYMNASAISYALLFSINIGWINCDRFIKIEEPKTNYTIALAANEEVDYSIVFDNYNAVMKGQKSIGAMTFKNVLKDEPITIFGIKNVDGQFYYCLKKSITSNAREKDLEFIPATKGELKAIAATLNRAEEI